MATKTLRDYTDAELQQEIERRKMVQTQRCAAPGELMHAYATVRDDGLVLRDDAKKVLVSFASVEEWNDYFSRHPLPLRLLCSSSMDFPEEYTSNKDVLALVRSLR